MTTRQGRGRGNRARNRLHTNAHLNRWLWLWWATGWGHLRLRQSRSALEMHPTAPHTLIVAAHNSRPQILSQGAPEDSR